MRKARITGIDRDCFSFKGTVSYCYFIHYSSMKIKDCISFLRDKKDEDFEKIEINDEVIIDEKNKTIEIPSRKIIIKQQRR